jgi:hypothetical protein
MPRRLALALSLATLPVFVACGDTTSPAAPAAEPAARAFAINGDYQSVTASSIAADTLTVRFLTAAGAPVAGVAVTWTADDASELTPLESTTASDGTARALFRADTKAGESEVTVASGAINTRFHLSIVAAAAKRLQLMLASVDTIEVGGTFTGAPVRVTDEFGNSVSGGQVDVTVFSNEDTTPVATLTLSANGDGVASLSDMPLPAGTHRIVYTLGAASVSYTVVIMSETAPDGD